MKMKNVLSNKYFLFTARFILGVTFIVASIDKIAIPEAFAVSIAAYKIVPYSLVNILALILPWLELICGIFLLAGVMLKGSAMIICSMLVVFIVALIAVLLQGLKIDCGCFGVYNSSIVSWWRIFEDVVLFFLGIQIFFFSDISSVDRNLSMQSIDE